MSLDSTLAPPVDERPPASRPRRGIDLLLTLTGEILVTLGVLLGLFVVWQLFYTDVQAARTQGAALDQLGFAEPSVVGPVSADGSDPSTGEELTIIPIIPDALKHTSPAGAPVMSEPGNATTFAALYVPRWGADYVKPMSEGVTRHDVLDKLGIGHYPGTAMPGGVGNFSVAGHRTTYGKPFSSIDTLRIGDKLIVQTDAAWYVYEVTETRIELPEYVAAISPTPGHPGVSPTKASITLTSCHPKYSAAKRYIVHGTLVYWAPTGSGFPPEIVEGS